MRRPLVLLLTFLFLQPAFAQDLPSPEEYFGFEMGADRKLARWDKLVEYYDMLGEASPRMNVVHSGPSTLGNPFLVLFISSPENLANLDALKTINANLADPRGLDEEEIKMAVADGKVVMVQSMGLHSSEVAASQMAAELTYDMLTRDDEEMMRILDNTISILIPCFNPDGEIMITDWYNETVGTEYEGARMPWLYHHYIGHDNNRDAFMQNTVESQYGAEIMFREWIPQAYIDHHQMGAFGPRLYVPPYAEPIRPDGDPLVWREMAWYGAHIAYKEEEAGRSGVVNAAIYSGWGHFGFHWITPFHNIAGMLTESASARYATPLYLHPDQLQGGRRGFPDYEIQTSFPNPWEGGWWRVRDIVEQQKISALAALDIAARNRETVLKNMVLKALRQTERGHRGDTKAFVIPSDQHDPLTMRKMINVLVGQGIEIHQAEDAFTHEGKVYGAGTYIVSLAQPKRGVIRWLLGRTFYPDNTYTRNRDGSPLRPYDMSTDNVAEYMGVRVDPVGSAVEAATQPITERLEPPMAEVTAGEHGYVIDGRLNDAFKAVNKLWDEDISVRRVTEAGNGIRPGDFLVGSGASAALLSNIADATGVPFAPLNSEVASTAISRPRIGMYQRYLGGNMDEGWTRLLLENFGFPYTTLRDADIQDPNLRRRFDVLILPADNVRNMTGERRETDNYDGPGLAAYPPEYRSGFGGEGVKGIERFVMAGGQLVTFAEASSLAIEKFDLPIRNVVAGVPTTEFWSPGSTLRMEVDTDHPVGYGMPEKALGLFLVTNQAYEVIPSDKNHQIDRVVTFVDRDIMESGWLLGEQHIANKAAVVSMQHGEGRIVLIGFRAQHRVQTHGTFKFVFNALVRGDE